MYLACITYTCTLKFYTCLIIAVHLVPPQDIILLSSFLALTQCLVWAKLGISVMGAFGPLCARACVIGIMAYITKYTQYKEGCTYMTVHVCDVTCVQCGTTCDVCVHFKTYNNYKCEGKRNKIFECCHFLCLCPGGGVGRSSGWNWRVH